MSIIGKRVRYKVNPPNNAIRHKDPLDEQGIVIGEDKICVYVKLDSCKCEATSTYEIDGHHYCSSFCHPINDPKNAFLELEEDAKANMSRFANLDLE